MTEKTTNARALICAVEQIRNSRQIAERAKSGNRMQIIGTQREPDNISVFWENKEENEGQIFVLKIVLGTLTPLKKRHIFHHSVLACSRLSVSGEGRKSGRGTLPDPARPAPAFSIVPHRPRAWNRLFRFVCLSLSDLWRHSHASLLACS